MSRPVVGSHEQPSLSVDVPPKLRRLLRLAAARRNLTVRQYLIEAIETRLRKDLGDYGPDVPALTAKADPVLAELWDNTKDAQYERL